jgi:formate/nitrite transporter FocA (FNT family)
MKYLSVLIKGILAGICISIGGFLCLKVNIAASSKVLGAFLFPIGLILICNFGYFLYTGKICYLFENKEQSYPEKLISLFTGLAGNLIGCLVCALLIRLVNKDAIAESLTSVFYEYSDSALLFKNLRNTVSGKINTVWYSTLILSAFCGMLVYIAVEGFKVIEHHIGKYLVLILAIAGFIICGFEHSIANMFYYFLAGNFSVEAFISILLIVIGNSIGGLFIPSLKMLMKKIEK